MSKSVFHRDDSVGESGCNPGTGVSAREPEPIIAVSSAIRQAISEASQTAPASIPILLVGPTGTGKDLFARHIHRWSGRTGRLVAVNCGALPRDLVEGLLFGAVRGVYTGALDRAGIIEAANRGTLFLDELLALPDEAQVKLLRVLDGGEVVRLGQTMGRHVTFGLVAAAQDDIGDQLRKGTFRLDLYQRVAGIVIRLPALAARPEDIVPLARYFAEMRGRLLSLEAKRILLDHPWPGNVRELRTVIERSMCLTDDQQLSPTTLRRAIELGAWALVEPPQPGRPQVGLATERELLLEALKTHRWHAGRTAKALGIGRTTLFRRLKVLHLSLRWPFELS